jgi:uncharacterized YigZ family protein
LNDDPDGYHVPASRGLATVVEKRSRFLAIADLAGTPAAALALVAERRREHHDAAHHGFAFKVGELERYSDDGEPAGTAGKPILNAITAAGLESVAVVVTRYFGGVKLGPGGLVRAYGEAAREALARSGAEERFRRRCVSVAFDFDLTSPVHHLMQKFDAQTLDSAYSDRVQLTLELRRSRCTRFLEELRDATSGRAEVLDVQ